ncbi:putative subunit of the multisubunit Na+/H+ antiporter [Leptolyngbyaceae cyanobacterium JSC-12]|nr:putative subunit of the multisubunit Na+/H+ antiporter [Leptolyngbyaceae cyanobacterium JSC-12]
MTDSYLYFVVALLPLAAGMVVLQDDPYHALVIRGILGAIAAMIYAVLGAADVALTEALVGTMLAITLYAIAVRSSLVMRLGILEEQSSPPNCPVFTQLADELRTILHKHHLRLELVPYTNLQSLQRALIDREVHAVCDGRLSSESRSIKDDSYPYHLTIRVHRLYEILEGQLSPQSIRLSYVDISDGSYELTSTNKTTALEESHP